MDLFGVVGFELGGGRVQSEEGFDQVGEGDGGVHRADDEEECGGRIQVVGEFAAALAFAHA